ncbi:ATP-dependent helicase Sgs1p [[Candida] jaroonii]|uniref:ATP-dependent helicase Sgs1p n=1 Tax=[Candida] jaroonii TaxID=467808 RepID=A0ACA9YFP9_9ASCO|nr:ATP-dependent helicase Sgs1p [[Candida] jaroonii]
MINGLLSFQQGDMFNDLVGKLPSSVEISTMQSHVGSINTPSLPSTTRVPPLNTPINEPRMNTTRPRSPIRQENTRPLNSNVLSQHNTSLNLTSASNVRPTQNKDVERKRKENIEPVSKRPKVSQSAKIPQSSKTSSKTSQPSKTSQSPSNQQPHPTNSSVISNTKEEIYKKYIKLLTDKSSLLTQRYLVFESSSISLDDKNKFINGEFTPKFSDIERKLQKLSKILPIDLDIDVNVDNLTVVSEQVSEVSEQVSEPVNEVSEQINEVDDINEPKAISNDPPPELVTRTSSYKELVEPDHDPFDEFDNAPIVTPVDSLDIENLSKNDDDMDDIQITQVNNVIELSSEDEDTPIPPVPTRSHVVTNASRSRPPIFSQEDEDDFGEQEMDGLLTPTQEREENEDTDLSGFIHDEEVSEGDFTFNYNSDVESIDDSLPRQPIFGENESDTDDDLIDTGLIDKNELEELKLSQDVAENLGIDYDEFMGTQINDEREINHEVIEISDYEYDEFDQFDDDSLIIKSEPIDVKEDDFEMFDDYDITTSKDIISEHVRNYGNPTLIKEIYQQLNRVFKLQNFRSNQFEAVINFLLGKDVFVLMPTGGGKSLCYQLPALVKPGISIVVSPLISLMQDQINHLTDKGISAGMISSKNNATERKEMIDLFRNGKLKLVYLSPEMINSSGQVQKIIKSLHEKKVLTSVIVDEAHCISSWGHDFRPDYKGMNFFKKSYPDIPIMALTATANDKVKLDIMHNLNMDNPIILKQSFNRINLYYEIKWKNNNYLEDVKNLVLNTYRDQTGIIYCHSKQSCEQISSKLNSMGANTSFYHAGMSTQDRQQVQQDWQSEKIKVICATIAFGMGIDKPNVRFVIHSFIPRNLEGYYQETGRAGRDGLKSTCIMFYSYKDARTLQLMIQKDTELNDTMKDQHLTKLRQVIQYCENIYDCRRKQVLLYFNENFNKANCNKTCDNCLNGQKLIEKDVTSVSKEILQLISEIENDKVTLLYCQDVYKGLNYAKITKNGHNELRFHGNGKKIDKLELERIFFHLISEDCLMEYSIIKNGFASNYVKLGKNANLVLKQGKKVIIKFATAPTTTSSTKATNPNVTVGFVSAKTNQPFNNEHIKKSIRELQIVRASKGKELNYKDDKNIMGDETLINIARILPTNQNGFIQCGGEKDYWIYFKSKILQLTKERTKPGPTINKPKYSNPKKTKGHSQRVQKSQSSKSFKSPAMPL